MTIQTDEEENKAIERIDFLKKVDRGLAKMRAHTQRLLDGLTPEERAIIERRFNADDSK